MKRVITLVLTLCLKGERVGEHVEVICVVDEIYRKSGTRAFALFEEAFGKLPSAWRYGGYRVKYFCHIRVVML